VQAAAAGGNATVSQVVHPDFEQRSVLARFPGTDPSLPLVVLGAHLDSINMFNESQGRSPGADDDGSGTVVLLEALRVLSAARFQPRNPVELQWYAAEEVGLRGSADIANRYREQGASVFGMMQVRRSTAPAHGG